MIYHTEGLFQIAFGDARTAFDPRNHKEHQSSAALLTSMPFNQLKKTMMIEQLIFLHQVHSDQGLTINSDEQIVALKPFSLEGDFLITTAPHIGLAIATADCLPIILYDPVNQVVGIVHAGWRGSVQSIAVRALEEMAQAYGSKVKNIRVFFGPSAKRCCYSVGSEVLSSLDRFYFKDTVIQKKRGSIFFDLPLFNRLQLQEAGVPKSAFNLAYNSCTICIASFCSYRRDKGFNRQITAVALR